jgi:transposase
MRVRPTYTEEFRADAVALLRKSDRSTQEVATSLGVSVWSLRAWYKQDVARKSGKKQRVLTSAEVAAAVRQEETPEERIARLEMELSKLQKRNAQLEMDREILKKAAAFFAKESE